MHRLIASLAILFAVVVLGLLIGLAGLAVLGAFVFPVVGPHLGLDVQPGPYSSRMAFTMDSALFMLLMFLVLLGAILFAGAILWRWFRRATRHGHLDVDESRMLQEMYHGLAGMEKRVESLERILLDPADRSGPARKESSQT